MKKHELVIYEKYKDLGYDVIKEGIPDLILLKDGKIEFVEVKSETDYLRPNQIDAINLLNKHGITVTVERIPPGKHRQPIFTKLWEQKVTYHGNHKPVRPELVSPRLASLRKESTALLLIGERI